MARGDKSAYTGKQQRMAEHIEEGYEDRGVSDDEAERRAWATVNKYTGGGRATTEGRENATERLDEREHHSGPSSSGHARGSSGGHSASRSEHEKRSEAAKKGWETRRKRDEA